MLVVVASSLALIGLLTNSSVTLVYVYVSIYLWLSARLTCVYLVLQCLSAQWWVPFSVSFCLGDCSIHPLLRVMC